MSGEFLRVHFHCCLSGSMRRNQRVTRGRGRASAGTYMLVSGDKERYEHSNADNSCMK
jgi:hypothetical protein